MTRIDPELGPVKTCSVCKEEWPLDEEFWYFQLRWANGTTRKSTVFTPYSRCRACWAERSREKYAAKRAGRPDRRYRGNGGLRWAVQ